MYRSEAGMIVGSAITLGAVYSIIPSQWTWIGYGIVALSGGILRSWARWLRD